MVFEVAGEQGESEFRSLLYNILIPSLNGLQLLEELKKQEKRGEIEIGYLDEMGWDSKPCIPYAWQEEKTTIKLLPIEGKRLNILGIMKRDNQLFYETQVGTVTSETVINFLDKYCQNIQKKTVIIIDQASIHTSDAFIEKLEEWEKKNLKIFWLPTYSPHLNLIEILDLLHKSRQNRIK